MPLLFDVVNDHLFIKGKKEGTEEGIEMQTIVTAVNMLLKTELTLNQIADLSSVKLEVVKKIKKELDKTKAKAIISEYKKDKLSEKEEKEKAERLIAELVKMPSLSEKVIALVVDWKEEEVDAFIGKLKSEEEQQSQTSK